MQPYYTDWKFPDLLGKEVILKTDLGPYEGEVVGEDRTHIHLKCKKNGSVLWIAKNAALDFEVKEESKLS